MSEHTKRLKELAHGALDQLGGKPMDPIDHTEVSILMLANPRMAERDRRVESTEIVFRGEAFGAASIEAIRSALDAAYRAPGFRIEWQDLGQRNRESHISFFWDAADGAIGVGILKLGFFENERVALAVLILEETPA